ncbi:MAG: sulfotransferase family protein [Actinomycetota bacterium]
MTATRSPIFVVGCARSGTTMLRAMLDAHRELAIPPESHFIPAMWRVRRRYGHPGPVDASRMASDVVSTFRFGEWGIPADAVRRRVDTLERPSFADAIDAVFLAYAGEHGKSRWGDKTPNYALDLALLADLFPDARFVHLVRDGRNVALSLLQMPWWPNTLPEAAQVWSHWTRKARSDGRALGPERYLEVRYEDLVDDPGASLRSVCAFAGLPYREEMLAYPESANGNGTPDYHRNAQRPPTRGLRDWTRDMSQEDVALFEALAGEQIRAMGYSPAFDRLPRAVRLRASTARIVTGITRDLREARVRTALAIRRDVLPPPRRW